MAYYSLKVETVTQKIIEKSRFITTSRHVSGEEEARAFISEINQKYRDATHNCYAYICDDLGNFPRFSDDGEPQGTAGMPVLEVIKNNRLYETAVAVTRYFGGVKLGAGGLVRAYSGCAAENIAVAEKVLYDMCVESKYILSYSSVNVALRFFGETSAEVLNTEYLDEAVFTVAVKKSEKEKFDVSLTDRLNGKLKISDVREYYYPFGL